MTFRSLFLASILFTQHALAGQDFPMFKGGAGRLGFVPRTLVPPVKELWRVNLKGMLFSSPVIAGDTVYLGSSAKRVYAFRLQDGKPVWETPLNDKVWGSTPAVQGGKVYVGGVAGCVHEIDAATGNRLREYCADEAKGMLAKRDLVASPLLFGSTLVFGTDDDKVYAFNADSGIRRWAYKAGADIHDNAACGCGEKIVLGSRDGVLQALDPVDGRLLWKQGPHKTYNTAPACDGKRVYAGAGDDQMRAFQLSDGKELWVFKADSAIMSSPSLGAEGQVVFGSSEGRVYALSPDGQLIWKFKTGDHVLASPLITGKTVWIGSFDDRFYALDLATGKELWRADLGSNIFTSAAVSGNLIVVAGRGGDLACFEASFADK